MSSTIPVYVVTAENARETAHPHTGQRRRHDLAKFFTAEAAQRHSERGHHNWTRLAVEERDEDENAQHEAHRAARR